MSKFFLFVSFLFSISIFSQKEVEIDFKKLNSKVSILINNHRKSLKLKEFDKDTFLLKAAEDHSLYLKKLGFLSHEQKDVKKKNPSDRVNFYGGKKFSGFGENILFTSIKQEKYSDKELDKLAQTIFNQWKNSPPHYKNIINKDFDAADLGFFIDIKRNRIYATHVFGRKGIEIPNQLSENAFGLKVKNQKCKTIDFGTKLHIGNSIQIEGENVILYYHDKQEFETIFSNPKDGIAIDFVEKEQMSCNKPNTFDISPIYDGVMSEPIYREELLKNNTAQNKYKLITNVGKVPSHLIGKEIVANVILIFDNCACEYVVPLQIKSKTIDLFPLDPIIELTNDASLSNKGIIYTEEILFEFDKNKVKSNNESYYKLHHKVHSTQIYSYSSVEGNEISNKKLHNDRAAAIQKFAKDSLGIKIKPSIIVAEENWEKCYIQLAMENMEYLASKPKNEIRKYINLKNKDFETYLNEQRVSKLVVNYYGEIDKDSLLKAQNSELFYDLNLKTAIFDKDYKKANLALSKIYSLEFSSCIFDEMVFNEIKTNPKLVQNATAVICKNFNQDYFKTTQFLKIWLEKFDSLPKNAQLNLLILYSRINSELLEKWDINFSKLTNVIKPVSVENKFITFKENKKLQSNFDYILLYYSNHINDYKNINEYFDRVYLSFKSNIKTKEDRMNLALFVNHWSVYSYSIALLKSEMNKPSFSKEEALLLAQTAALFFEENNAKTNQQVLNKVYQLNKKEWCEWQKENFNLLRNEQIKSDFCKKCNNM
ncbi:CAP domain-containing protein [Flavobacterium cyclinae]|uniref:CAP domain-containing protein n=1 Tax=Flavobacterium cyclinae TaxID=2895947 RepID=UPI001E54ABB5|nr:CAP domain-containing protein [Flavobacterium cyclinae]UGS21992.1 CAP domain-containing protein [Flavobacterium cyclinae]